MANVYDVASYILSKTGEISTMKLQKLVYYSQAWSLVWDEEPLFNDEIQAWVNGPVVPNLYSKHAKQFTVADIMEGNSANLSDPQKETIDIVLGGYGKFSGSELSNLSHSESPWRDARAGLGRFDRSSNTIGLTAMQDYYTARRG